MGGLSNYAQAISDPALLSSVGRVLLFGVVQVPVMLIIAMLFALILDSSLARLKRFFRLSYLCLCRAGRHRHDRGVLFTRVSVRSPTSSRSTSSATDGSCGRSPSSSWTYAGYNMLIMHLNLQAIDRDIYEAAHVDGATNWQIALRIKIR